MIQVGDPSSLRQPYPARRRNQYSPVHWRLAASLMRMVYSDKQHMVTRIVIGHGLFQIDAIFTGNFGFNFEVRQVFLHSYPGIR